MSEILRLMSSWHWALGLAEVHNCEHNRHTGWPETVSLLIVAVTLCMPTNFNNFGTYAVYTIGN